MRLSTVYVRFYKSFNFDYLRKSRDGAVAYPWEMVDQAWYPYVRIPIDARVTTVVGANESGKSHLLSCIEKGISGKGIEREDFCRYSRFFTVAKGERMWPEFGFEWVSLTEPETEVIRAACSIPAGAAFSSFFMFRTDRTTVTVYLHTGTGYTQYAVSAEAAKNIVAILPKTFRLDSALALPSSVPLRALSRVAEQEANHYEKLARSKRYEFVSSLGSLFGNREWFQNAESVAKQASSIVSSLAPAIAATSGTGNPPSADIQLVKDLLLKVAGIDEEAFDDLYNALKNGKDGHVSGLMDRINAQLAARLNFPKWWAQDKTFSLTVACRDHDLIFTIKDRTGTEYSFSERSSGLKYFLSYYVQYRAHSPHSTLPELLIMDEPDAYLSSQAQQDLLKIFEAFATPSDGSPPVQVIYVTHSPFLIDKNHAERIRVLEKGISDEGTRVVRDASKNHYEPLRSAFGSFVAETTFIGNCNLMVEGIADQVLLAGAASILAKNGKAKIETLDLKQVTLVPAGSASHIPYLVYLARGRDVEQPAVIVLLDSDKSGNDARKQLKRGGANGRRVLDDKYVLQIHELDLGKEGGPTVPEKLKEIEDLIPLAISTRAARRYAEEISGVPGDTLPLITEANVCAKITAATSAFEGLESLFLTLGGDAHIEKVGFARLVIDDVRRLGNDDRDRTKFIANFKSLFKALNAKKREALRVSAEEKVSERLKRHKKAFLDDHPFQATREEAYILLETLESVLDPSSPDADAARIQIQILRRDYELEESMTELVSDFQRFRDGLDRVTYAGRISTQDEVVAENHKLNTEIVDGVSDARKSNAPLLVEKTLSQTGNAVAHDSEAKKNVVNEPTKEITSISEKVVTVAPAS